MTAVFSPKYQPFIVWCHKLPGLLEKATFSFYLRVTEDTTEKFPNEIVTKVRSI
jgi:hypothetical protein